VLSGATRGETLASQSEGKTDGGADLAASEPSPRIHALDGWVLATLPRALAFATGLVKDREAAEDLVHDCYCRLLARAEEYDLRQDGARLLFRSITNACIDRSRRKSAVSLFDDGDEDGTGRMLEIADRRSTESWQLASHGEMQRAVAAGLQKLPATQRAALELKTLGQSLQDIAEALSVTPSNAGVLIHRARQALAQHIAAYLDA